MADDERTIILPAAELPAFRAAVIDCTDPQERRRCERLLGQLASLEAAVPDATLRFVPAPQTERLARRAAAHLRRARP